MPDDLTNFSNLKQLLKAAIVRDQDLRAKYEVGEKFRFVKDKLQNFLIEVEKTIEGAVLTETTKSAEQAVNADEVVVYVYLFNAQGLVFQSWRNMLTAKLLYEYSINRPIYSDKKSIYSLIRTKQNKAQHGFLTIKIKRNDILTGGMPISDSLGNELIKIREGALHYEKLLNFTHNEIEYEVSPEGNTTKVEEKN